MADSWERLKQECGVCRGCALADTRTHVVFGDGCETAEIMLIGEGPGQHEDEQGIPFVGRAGQLLDDMLEIIHLDRHQGLHRQRGEVPPASEPGPSECGAGRLHRLSAAAGGADEAQDHRLSGPDRRQGHHQGGLQDHRRSTGSGSSGAASR